MQQDTIDGFVRLRESILNEIGPLVAQSDMPVSERFDIYLRLARSNGGVDYYEKAYGLLKDNEAEDKLNLYLGLLSDVDFEINNATDGTEDQVASPQPEA